MNREIKFRAWDTDNLKMHYFDELSICDNAVVFENSNFDLGENHNDDKNATLMQFTGLLDKSGKEIYEGDILETGTKEEILKVFYNSSLACFDIEFMGGDCERLVSENGWKEDLKEYKYKIIGNIYENPDLLP